ncbi:extracellular solute-binding protein, partial [Ruminococcaceae bacterium OttesenSCG-928-L11]|nr:extracellular solute-binding protein [Ruminococcaceae bacterium OttesenSCG-928-L11]
AKEYERLTGVKINYQHPPTGQAKDQFNLILASRDFPDIMDYQWLKNYPGGPQKALDDDVVVNLNDVISQYSPDLRAYLDANPDIDKQVRTDEGNYYVYPFIREADAMCASLGPMIRQDWLDDLGLAMPKTLAELENVLIQFRDQKGAIAPYTFDHKGYKANDPIMYANGTTNTFQIDGNGEIVYGAITPEYKSYLETLNRWYKEGLLDPDFATIDRTQQDAKVTTGQSGMTLGWVGSGMGAWNPAGQQNDPNFLLAPLNYVSVDGGKPEYGYLEFRYGGQGSCAITTGCDDVELAARYLNFGYTDEGYMANNFGTEGESYTMVNGTPTYTDFVLANPDGWPVAQGLGAYVRSAYSGQFIQSLGYQDQYFTTDVQRQGPPLWSQTNMDAHRMPNITPTSEESTELATIMNDIETYRDEMTLKFILGTESLDKYDTYVSTIENMNLASALEIQKAALVRFNNR